MPNRILKESICTSDNIDRLTPFQETVFYRLIVTCDDYGRMDARPKLLASKLFPLKDIRPAQIADALRALTSAELVFLYEVDGKPFLQMKTWDRHQRVRNSIGKYPAPESGSPQVAASCGELPQAAASCGLNPNPIRIQSESNIDMQNARRFTPPTVEEVRAYCRERNNSVDAEKFVSFYAAKGWMIGKNHMKDWKQAVITWERGEGKQKPAKTVIAQQYDQRDYSQEQPRKVPDWMLEDFAEMQKEGAG